MNSKGFTLIELLAVIVILSIIAIIAVPIIINIIDESKNNAILRSAEMYLDAVEMSIATSTLDNKNIESKTYDIMSDGNICLKEYVRESVETCGGNTLDELNEEDILKVEVTGEYPKEGTITLSNNVIKDINIFLNEERIVKNDNGEVIHFPCILIRGDKNTNGSKYECEVSQGVKYNFYVLSQESDGTTNLIMDRNICEDGTPTAERKTCLVAWNNEQHINSNGPITAMRYLYNATKTWVNIAPLNYEYEDQKFQGMKENGYTSFVSEDGIATITSILGEKVVIGTNEEPLRARMPIYTDDSNNSLKNEISSFNNNNNNNIYLFEYIDGDAWAYGSKPSHKISGIYGYWTLSANGGSYDDAWTIYYDGNVEGYMVDGGTHLGIRPVINLKF